MRLTTRDEAFETRPKSMVMRYSEPVPTAICLLVAGISAFVASSATACDVPVFRYVLERFGTDPQELVIFHRGPLPTDMKQSVAAIRKQAGNPQSPLTIQVRLVDVTAGAGKKPARDAGKAAREPAAYHGRPSRIVTRKLDWAPPSDAPLPLLAVIPMGGELTAPLWTGPLRGLDFAALMDSPTRRELVRRLFRGDSAVFLLLKSGQSEADAAAEELLRTTLAEQEMKLTLPPKDGPSLLLTSLPLKIAFSVLNVARNDANERFFVQMLQNLGEQAGLRAGPIVFPIFGRGRALTALDGRSLRAEAIQEICEFLCGECSCGIKGQVPGVDLLMAVDWDAKLASAAIGTDSADAGALGSLAVVAASATNEAPAKAVPAARGAAPPANDPPDRTTRPLSDAGRTHSGLLIWTLLAILAGGVGLIMIGTLAIKTLRRDGDR